MADDWESALRKLTRDQPPRGGSTSTFVTDAMNGDLSDRAAALVMASIADATLQGAIAMVLRLHAQDQFNAMFYGDGPFSTFDRRIIGASTLKIIGPVTSTNAKVIKNVRNVFAHAMSDVTFLSEPISRACGQSNLRHRATPCFMGRKHQDHDLGLATRATRYSKQSDLTSVLCGLQALL